MLQLYDPSREQPSGPLTVRQVISLYWQIGDQTTSERARQDSQRVLDLFAHQLGDQPVANCSKKDLTLFLSDHPEWESEWTRSRVVRTVNRPFNWAAGEGFIPANPFKGARCRPGPRGRPMELRERQALLRAGNPAFRRALIGLWYTGARPGELRSLRWEHIHFERSCAILHVHKTVTTRRDRAPRVIVLHPVMVKLLVFLRRRHPYSEFCFNNTRGRPWTRPAFDLAMWYTRKRAKVDPSCKWHSVRHAYGTAAAVNGVELATLAALLGHTSTRMAEHYVHLAGRTDHLQEALLKTFRPKQTE